jgi:hypothetical protein
MMCVVMWIQWYGKVAYHVVVGSVHIRLRGRLSSRDGPWDFNNRP